MTRPRFTRFAAGVLLYNVLVVLWGAYVRASGSGAGCGAHWPLCNGEIVPRAPRIETLIELSHRVTSGLALVLVAALVFAATRAFPRGAPARRAAWASLAFVLAEALIGAGLVLFELVAHDASSKRALSMALHLVNTFFLLGALALTLLFGATQATSGLRLRARPGVTVAFAIAALGLLVLGTSGAVAALGDTLFPSASLGAGLAQDLSPGAHLFVRLRVLHPVLAVFVGGALTFAGSFARWAGLSDEARRFGRILGVLAGVQIVAGAANVLLLAPVAMQIVHLLFADAVWIALVLFAGASLAPADQSPIISKNGPAPSSDVPPSTSKVAPVT